MSWKAFTVLHSSEKTMEATSSPTMKAAGRTPFWKPVSLNWVCRQGWLRSRCRRQQVPKCDCPQLRQRQLLAIAEASVFSTGGNPCKAVDTGFWQATPGSLCRHLNALAAWAVSLYSI